LSIDDIDTNLALSQIICLLNLQFPKRLSKKKGGCRSYRTKQFD